MQVYSFSCFGLAGNGISPSPRDTMSLQDSNTTLPGGRHQSGTATTRQLTSYQHSLGFWLLCLLQSVERREDGNIIPLISLYRHLTSDRNTHRQGLRNTLPLRPPLTLGWKYPTENFASSHHVKPSNKQIHFFLMPRRALCSQLNTSFLQSFYM